MKQSAMSPRTGRIIELDIAKGLEGWAFSR